VMRFNARGPDGLLDGNAPGPRSSMMRWPRLSEQIFRVDKWSVCQG
jgi:hypothetical protein